MQAWLTAGIPLKRLDVLRPTFEQRSFSLTPSTHLSHLIPALLESELQTLKSELQDQQVLVIYDGTAGVAEVFAIVV
jgi:hypothetical protein